MSTLFDNEDWEPSKPESDDELWRYIDFTQFVSILEKEALWLAAASVFLDPWEGGLTKEHVKSISERIPFIDERSKFVRNVFDALRATTYVSCWHQREDETAAMWELYNNRGKEVAIKTTYGGFIDAVDISDDMTVGMVNYTDYSRGSDEFRVTRESPFFHKRNSFDHEMEFRAVKSEFHVPDLSEVDDEFKHRVTENAPPGRAVGVNPSELIDEIVISPVAGGWMEGLVEDVLETYDLSNTVKVHRSKMNEDPFDVS